MSNIDEPDPRLDYTLNSSKGFDDGHLSVNKQSIKTSTFVEDVYNVYKKITGAYIWGWDQFLIKAAG